MASRSRTVLSKLVARAGCPRALEGTRFRVWLRGRSLGTGGSVRGKEGSRKPGRVCSPTSWQEVLHPELSGAKPPRTASSPSANAFCSADLCAPLARDTAPQNPSLGTGRQPASPGV